MMAQQPIRMTKGFSNANIKAGQMTDADANGEWQKPPNISAEAEKEFVEIMRRVSTQTSPSQAG
ncbi:MAG: hypothetical protein CL922_09250 [Deltaproteobacteria bacterium]|nr:hypothetical protein [Deltaproteobacteria bacterium]